VALGSESGENGKTKENINSNNQSGIVKAKMKESQRKRGGNISGGGSQASCESIGAGSEGQQ